MAKAYSEDLRIRVIQNYLVGQPKIDIIAIFKISMDTLNRWIRLYSTTGSIQSQPRTKYRTRKFSDDALTNYINANPSVTIAAMARYFSVKSASVYARLKLLGITYKKKTFLYQERDAQERAEFIHQLTVGAQSQPVVFTDESKIYNNINYEYGWSKRGKEIIADKKSKATEKINIIGGLFKNKILAPLTYPCNTDTEVFNFWLEKCLIPELPEKCIIVMDNASFHKSAETQDIIKDNGHTLLFLPRYSPDLNPIEGYWGIIKRKLRKIINNYNNLFDALHEVFKSL
jgi:transposase